MRGRRPEGAGPPGSHSGWELPGRITNRRIGIAAVWAWLAGWLAGTTGAIGGYVGLGFLVISLLILYFPYSLY